MKIFWATLACLMPIYGNAITVYLPNNAVKIEEVSREDSTELPTAVFTHASQPTMSYTGMIERQSWWIDGALDPKTIIESMNNALERQGFTKDFECSASYCGGFAFRFALETSPPPYFRVNLDNYYYAQLSHEAEIVTLLASVVDGKLYLNQLHITKNETKAVPLFEADAPNIAPQTQSAANDRIILSSVIFAQGSSTISNFDENELASLASKLKASPNSTLYIVGHSDQSGGLEGNLAISQARAQAVVNLLKSKFGVASEQIFAKGVAFLAPIADNSTDEGRTKNRRVEAVILNN